MRTLFPLLTVVVISVAGCSSSSDSVLGPTDDQPVAGVPGQLGQLWRRWRSDEQQSEQPARYSAVTSTSEDAKGDQCDHGPLTLRSGGNVRNAALYGFTGGRGSS